MSKRKKCKHKKRGGVVLVHGSDTLIEACLSCGLLFASPGYGMSVARDNYEREQRRKERLGNEQV